MRTANISYKVKLLAAPAICLVLFALAALGATWGFGQQRSALDMLYKERFPGYVFAARFESSLRDVNGLVNQILGYQAMGYSDEEVRRIESRLAAKSLLIRKDIEERRTALGAQERQSFDVLSGKYANYEKAVSDTLDMRQSGPTIAVGLTTSQKLYEDLLGELSRASQSKLEQAGRDVEAAGASAAKAEVVIMTSAVTTIAMAFVISLVVALGLTRRLEALSKMTALLAAGDLTCSLKAVGSDEVGRLMRDLESVRLRLATSLETVYRASLAVHEAAKGIALSSSDLSEHTEEQAGSLQQTTTAMELLNTMIRHNESAAIEANELADSASRVAAMGASAAQDAAVTMGEIIASSRSIADIVTTIDGLAFQTNILALNAAVEAARAGDNGRGFSIVAGEVRSLALRSAEAAKEIRSLIVDSEDKVAMGSRVVSISGSTMKEILDQVRKVRDMIDGISTASAKQTQGIGEITYSVDRLDRVTHKNAALVEQSAAAAKRLHGLATNLVRAVGEFRLDASPQNCAESAGALYRSNPRSISHHPASSAISIEPALSTPT